MAGRPPTQRETDVLDEQQRKALGASSDRAKVLLGAKETLLLYQLELHDAIAANEGSISDERAVALGQRRVWNMVALVHQLEGDDDAAAIASREAVRHGELAVKLAKATLNDRVAALEAEVGKGRTQGKRIREEARKRSKKRG